MTIRPAIKASLYGGIALAEMLCSMSVNAQPLIMGTNLHKYCNDDLQTAQIFCMAYVGGVSDVLKERYPNFRACLGSVTGLKQVDVVKKYLFNNPERRNVPAATVVADAIDAAFSCGK